ncbi:MAG: hypothetical protein LBH74_06770, partial [Nitrososphaerota archaeon]|nr:hypothetical protein [Nitrososphaerota archaeon]
MKSKMRYTVSIVILLTLIVGCFAALPQTARAADPIYTLTDFVNGTSSTNTIYTGSGSSTASATQMKLVGTDGSVIYAICVNQKVTTTLGVKYELVELKDYPGLTQTQKDQILAVLNYVSINYGLETAKGTALAQTVIWRIIHSDITRITSSAISEAEINDVFNHRFDLATQYDNLSVTIQGTDSRVENGMYAYYGPFKVSDSYALKDINFNLLFTAGGANAAFTTTTSGSATINQIKPGVSFYVRVPVDTSQATISFSATASKAVNVITGMKFLVSVGSNSQPLVVYQPLVQPLVNPNGKLYTYSCDRTFTIDLRGSLKVSVDVAKTIHQDVVQRDVWDIVQRDVWDIVQRDVWDIVQRDVWDIVQRDVWD